MRIAATGIASFAHRPGPKRKPEKSLFLYDYSIFIRMKILITGSAGFIASSLIPKLKADGHELVGVDSLVSGSINCQFTSADCIHHFFDITNASKLNTLLEGVDLVYHLAAKGNVVESVEDPVGNFVANVNSTISLLESMRLVGCKRLIFSSTGGALMGNAIPPVDESTIPKPISPYGASKLACEGYLSAYAASYDFSSIVLRFGNVYGPFSSHKAGVVNLWIRSLIKGDDVKIYGDGESSRDYIHVDDLTDGLLLALKRLNCPHYKGLETYHLANHVELTLNQLKEIVFNAFSSSASKVVYYPARPGEVNRNFADISLAKRVLNFNPSIPFDRGIQKLCNWILAHEF